MNITVNAVNDVLTVSVSGDIATVHGTAGDDVFDVIAGQDYVTVNGTRYDFNASGVSRMLVEGSGGQDTITVTGDNGDDTATLSFGQHRALRHTRRANHMGPDQGDVPIALYLAVSIE